MLKMSRTGESEESCGVFIPDYLIFKQTVVLFLLHKFIWISILQIK